MIGSLVGRKRSEAEAYRYVHDRLLLDTDENNRLALESVWFSALSYYGGNQSVEVGYEGKLIPRKPTWVNTYQANMIRPHVQRAVAKVLSRNAQFGVTPRSAAREDRMAARVANEVFEGVRYTVQWERTSEQSAYWAAICGTGITKISWDPDGGKLDRIYVDEEKRRLVGSLLDPEVRDRYDREGMYEDEPQGDVRLDIVPLFSFYPDPRSRTGTLDDCEWVAQIQYVGVKTAETMFPGFDFEKEVDTPNSGAHRGAQRYLDSLAAMTPDVRVMLGLHATDYTQNRRVRVTEFWERPLRSNKMRGRRIVLVGSVVVVSGDNPYVRVGTPLPYAIQHWDYMPGRFWGIGIGEQMRGPQRAYNMSRAAMMQYQKKHVFPVTWIGKSANVQPKQLANVPGLILEYSDAAAAPPVSTPAPNVPPHVTQNAAIAQSEMGILSAHPPPESSSLPGSLRSGQAIGLMQADQNSILIPTIKEYLRYTAECGRQMLRLAGAFYDTARVLEVVGNGGQLEPLSFVGSDLRGHYEVRVLGMQAALESPESARANLMDMAQLGVLNVNDPADRSLILRGYMAHSSDEAMNAKSASEEKQDREIKQMIENPLLLVQPQPWEDHQAHVASLERFMRSREFDDLEETASARIVAHWKAHSDILSQQMQAQMQVAQLLGGGQGQPSKPRVSRQ